MAFRPDYSYTLEGARAQARGLAGLGGTVGDLIRERRQAGELEQQRGLAREAMGGDVEAQEELAIVAPELSQRVMATLGARTEQQQKGLVYDLANVLNLHEAGDTQGALNYMDQRIETVRAAGRDPSHTQRMRDLYERDPEKGGRALSRSLLRMMDPQQFAKTLVPDLPKEDKAWAPTTLKKLITERDALLEKGFSLESPEVQAYNNKISGADIDIEDMSQDEIDFWGANMNLTGKMPSFGRGKQATKIRQSVARSAARQALGHEEAGIPEGEEGQTPAEAALEVVATQTDTRAIEGSLKALDKQLSSMGSFVTNLNSQIDKVAELSKDLETFDVRMLNVPLRKVRRKLKGSPIQAKYDMYLAEIEAEIGKLATGSTGSVAELSATAQEKWSKIHDKNLSVKDMLSLLEETRNAANYREQSVRDQLDKTRERMRTRVYQPKYQEGQTATGPQGQKIIFRGGKWRPM